MDMSVHDARYVRESVVATVLMMCILDSGRKWLSGACFRGCESESQP